MSQAVGYDSDVSSGSESTASGWEEKPRAVERCRRLIDVRKGGARVVVRQYVEVGKEKSLKKIVKREGTKKVLEVTVEVLGVVQEAEDTPECNKFTKCVVRRSLKQFVRLAKKLTAEHPSLPIPVLKGPNPNIPHDPNELQDLPPLVTFLKFVLTHPDTCKSQVLWDFLTLASDDASEIVKIAKKKKKLTKPNVAELKTDLKKASAAAKTGAKKFMAAGLKSLKNLKEKPVDKADKKIVETLQNQCQRIYDQVKNGEATLKSARAQEKLSKHTAEVIADLSMASRSISWALYGCSEAFSDVAFKSSSAFYRETTSHNPPLDNKLLLTASTRLPGSICHQSQIYAGLHQPEYTTSTTPSPITLETRWMYTVVTPASVHRVRSAPSRTASHVKDLVPGQTILLDMTRSLENGEEWGFSIEENGWTLLSDEGMSHLAPSALLKVKDEVGERYTTGDVVTVISTTGKPRDGMILVASNGVVNVHYMGFDSKNDEWLPSSSLRLYPLKPKAPSYALQAASNHTSMGYNTVGGLYLKNFPESVFESVIGMQYTTGLVGASERLIKNSRGGLSKAEKVEREYLNNVEIGDDAVNEVGGVLDEVSEGVGKVWREHENCRNVVRNGLGRYVRQYVENGVKRAEDEVACWEGVLEMLEGSEVGEMGFSFNDVLVVENSCSEDVLGGAECFELENLITPLTAKSSGFGKMAGEEDLDIFGDVIPKSQQPEKKLKKQKTNVPPIPTLTPSKILNPNLGPLPDVETSEEEEEEEQQQQQTPQRAKPRLTPPMPAYPPPTTTTTYTSPLCDDTDEDDLPVPEEALPLPIGTHKRNITVIDPTTQVKINKEEAGNPQREPDEDVEEVQDENVEEEIKETEGEQGGTIEEKEINEEGEQGVPQEKIDDANPDAEGGQGETIAEEEIDEEREQSEGNPEAEGGQDVKVEEEIKENGKEEINEAREQSEIQEKIDDEGEQDEAIEQEIDNETQEKIDGEVPVNGGECDTATRNPVEGDETTDSETGSELQEAVVTPPVVKKPAPKTSLDLFELHLNRMKPLEVDESLFEEECKKTSARKVTDAWDDL